MRFYLCIIVFLSSAAFCQEKFRKKLEKELGQTLVENRSDYSKPTDSITTKPVWSRVQDSVQIGQTYDGEFVQFLWPQENDVLSGDKQIYITENAISKEEFLEFRQWIIDSTARKLAYFGQEDGWFFDEWLMIPTRIKKEGYRMNLPFDIDNREDVANTFPLNWDKKFYYNDPVLVPIFSQLYPASAERFRKVTPFDHRKVYYHFGKPHSRNLNKVPVMIDSYDWLFPWEHSFAYGAVLSYLDDKILLDQPVKFIEPFMAEAYCHWKTLQWKKQLGSKGVNVLCRLPNPAEIDANPMETKMMFIADAYDHTENWRITNSEFKAFCESVLDSVCREFLYFNELNDEDVLDLIQYKNYYYSEDDLEYVELDPSRRQECRDHFPLSDSEIRWKNFGYLDREDFVVKNKVEKVTYRYEWIDAESRSAKETSFDEDVPRRRNTVNGENLVLPGQMFGHTGFGTKDHKNLKVFLKKTAIAIPLPYDIPEGDALAELSYEEALAYYNWKYRIDKYDGEGDWLQYIFPSKQEYEAILKGDKISYPEQEIPFDAHVFRMVVEIVKN